MPVVIGVSIAVVVWLVGQNVILYLWLPRLVAALVNPIAAELRHLRTSLEGRIADIERRFQDRQENP
ncbi:hypothetical protein OV203_02530 [Nannocystis sp. ILAH1]|uniref:hypothetical protein n=1 Tax=Nannocystis sp. ILAH1 TaxID=2996789 RepID=UPI00226DA8F2|nr:hypothetical protein [Nannocystis sp. ILAH1]MCY0985988.1 hypothetical protein [Nannocystis sp. ILAH1]